MTLCDGSVEESYRRNGRVSRPVQGAGSPRGLDLSRVLKSIRGGGWVDLSRVLNQRTDRMQPPIRSLAKGLSPSPPSFPSLTSVSRVLGLLDTAAYDSVSVLVCGWRQIFCEDG